MVSDLLCVPGKRTNLSCLAALSYRRIESMWSLLQKQEHLLALKVLTGSLPADVEKNKKQKPPSVGKVCILQRRRIILGH